MHNSLGFILAVGRMVAFRKPKTKRGRYENQDIQLRTSPNRSSHDKSRGRLSCFGVGQWYWHIGIA